MEHNPLATECFLKKFTLQVLSTKFLIFSCLIFLFSFYQLVAICNWNWMPCPQLELNVTKPWPCFDTGAGIWHNMMTYYKQIGLFTLAMLIFILQAYSLWFGSKVRWSNRSVYLIVENLMFSFYLTTRVL